MALRTLIAASEIEIPSSIIAFIFPTGRMAFANGDSRRELCRRAVLAAQLHLLFFFHGLGFLRTWR